MTIGRIRRRRFIRAIHLAVAGLETSMRTLLPERGIVGRSGSALQPALR
jgi:hypothetical protein